MIDPKTPKDTKVKWIEDGVKRKSVYYYQGPHPAKGIAIITTRPKSTDYHLCYFSNLFLDEYKDDLDNWI